MTSLLNEKESLMNGTSMDYSQPQQNGVVGGSHLQHDLPYDFAAPGAGVPLIISPMPEPAPRILSSRDPGRYALIVLTCINLLNYIDRYVPSATKQYFEADLHLDDTQSGIPLTAFVFVYMLFSPIFSHLADKGYRRPHLIASGVVIWSIATAAGALAVDFWSFLAARAMVGVGEAAYATIAPALLSDYYRPEKRNAALSIFYMAIPIGAAMGYGIGGEVGGYLGWRYAFLVSGAPGLLVAAMCLGIREPPVGAADDPTVDETTIHAGATGVQQPHHVHPQHDLMFGLNQEGMDMDDDDEETAEHPTPVFAVQAELGGPAPMHPQSHVHYHPARRASADTAAHTVENTPTILVRSRAPTDRAGDAPPSRVLTGHLAHGPPPPWKESILMLLRNPSYMYATMGYTCVVFASGGLADWFPSWMNRVHNVPKDTASTTVGGITCVAGIIGTAYGSWAGEFAKGKIKQPYLGVPALNMIITTTCAWLVMFAPNIYLIGALIFVAQIAMWAYTGPINALTINCVPANMRVRAFAMQIFLTHSLGDAISPTIVGKLSDAFDSIRTALFIIPVAFSLAVLVWGIGWRRTANDEIFDGTVPIRRSRANSLVAGAEGDTLHDPLMADAPADMTGGSLGYLHEPDHNAIHLKRFEAKQTTRNSGTIL